jgi:hypothetical protein
MAVSKARVAFFMRKLKWIDAICVGVGKDHFTAHVAMVIGHHMNSDTGETFVGRETIADLIGGHVRLSNTRYKVWNGSASSWYVEQEGEVTPTPTSWRFLKRRHPRRV